MSWQAYVDSSLVGSGHIDKACIVSAAGDSTWATTPDFQVKPEELKAIVAVLNEPDKTNGAPVVTAYSEGLHVAGERFVATRVEDRHIYGRKEKTGICIVKTKQTILIGHYGENVQAGNATQTVEALADYLINVGY
ncbi:Profilin/allergen [Parathielavia appendiculata]|uniref:Profilin n=1 Tax=Parathielavia appendiculata TaxID=2587402 RepID=A0AAN6U4Z3_9PEZI|nr:Profilin/allergen [Parathielavia appendiculata]